MRPAVTTQEQLDDALNDAAANPSVWHEIVIASPAGVWLALSSTPGSATVTASGSATVRASGSATVRASGSATVTASGSATVRASDSATVTAYGSATVTASGSATVRASDSATVRASGSATVTAYGSATVTAYGSATVRAYGSATVRASDSATVTAYGSATVTAYGSATVRAYGSATVRASKYVAIHLHDSRVTVNGGVLIDVTRIDQTHVGDWIDYTGAEVDGDHVVLYKAVNADLKSERGFAYPIGETVEAPDWTDTNDCGGGLHLSPLPEQAREYFWAATRFLRCHVHRDDLRPIPGSPAKAKARRVTVVEEVSL